MAKGLSNSRYTQFCQCPKAFLSLRACREALLRYCELDIWAMVKVWEKVKEVTQ